MSSSQSSAIAVPLDCAIIANLEVNGLHSFHCYRHVALQSLTPVMCHVFMHCLGSFLIMQDMSPRIRFRGTKCERMSRNIASS